jgi:micrococcal nuclease
MRTARRVGGLVVLGGSIAAAAIWILPLFLPAPTPDSRPAEVARVIDGDTVVVLLDGAEQRVRLIGIDTPETTNGKNECGGTAATQALLNLTAGRPVELVVDPTQANTDRYDRLLRYIQVDGRDAGQVLLENGLAHEYTYRSSDPYVKQDAYRTAAAQAQEQDRGSWHDCDW